MKSIATLSIIFTITLASCSTAKKSYFTVDTRKRVEEKAIPMEKLQFYVDKDVELRRELASRETKVTSGKVILENGKYVNIILLKAGTFERLIITSTYLLKAATIKTSGSAYQTELLLALCTVFLQING